MSEYKTIWSEAFSDSSNDWANIFADAYSDSEAITIDEVGTDTMASALLLRDYTINWLGGNTRMAYIMGAATRRKLRGKGYMTRLMHIALNEAYRRGFTLLTITPANDYQFEFFSHFGLANVVFEDRRRYVSDAPFATTGKYIFTEITSPAPEEVTRRFIELEQQIGGHVIHTPTQFNDIIKNTRNHSGRVLMAQDEDGLIRAVAAYEPSPEILTITGIVADDNDAERALTREIGSRFPLLPMVVNYRPTQDRPIQRKAMGRIINTLQVLSLVARNVDATMAIRVHDPIIEQNNHTYIIANKSVKINDTPRNRYDLDVDISVLTKILCSDRSIGRVFSLPSQRPYISLMLG